MSVDAAADRYASALFELAQQLGNVAEVDGEIQRASVVALNERILVRALVAPDIPENVKHKIVQEVFGTRVSSMVLNFLRVLVDTQRFGSLPAIAREYHTLMQDAQGEVQVDVDTAIELQPDVRKQVEAEVKRHTGRAPVVRWHVVPDILGGVVVRIKDNIIDYSLKSQLHQLRERLLKAQN